MVTKEAPLTPGRADDYCRYDLVRNPTNSSPTPDLSPLADALAGSRSILIASHNNPDPDSIASAVLLKTLLTRKYRHRPTISYSGVIGRAENAAMLAYAGEKFFPLNTLDLGSFDSIVLVDTQPGTGNHGFTLANPVRMVFDHHRLRPETRKVSFYEVRTNIGATTTLLFLYWKAAGLPVPRKYATFMLYALSSETADMAREASSVDRDVYRELYAVADLRALSAISNARVGREYFATVRDAIERSTLYGPIVVTRLGRLPYPDVVAQIAEYFLKFNRADYTLAVGQYGSAILLSMRCSVPGTHLGGIARRIVKHHGTAGGHGSSAGGQIDIRGRSQGEIDTIKETVIKRFIAELGFARRRGRKLVIS